MKTARKVHKFVTEAKKHGVDAVYFQQIYDMSKLTKQQKRYYSKAKPACRVGTFGAKYFEIQPPKKKLFTKYNFDLWQNKKFEKYLERKV